MLGPTHLSTAALFAIALAHPLAARAPESTNCNYMLSQGASLSGASSVSFTSGTPHPFPATIGAVSGMSKLYLGVGAMVQTLANSPIGAYTATGQVTAGYSDL